MKAFPLTSSRHCSWNSGEIIATGASRVYPVTRANSRSRPAFKGFPEYSRGRVAEQRPSRGPLDLLHEERPIGESAKITYLAAGPAASTRHLVAVITEWSWPSGAEIGAMKVFKRGELRRPPTAGNALAPTGTAVPRIERRAGPSSPLPPPGNGNRLRTPRIAGRSIIARAREFETGASRETSVEEPPPRGRDGGSARPISRRDGAITWPPFRNAQRGNRATDGGGGGGYRSVYSPRFRRFRVQGQLPAASDHLHGTETRGAIDDPAAAAVGTAVFLRISDAAGTTGGCVRRRDPFLRNSTRWPRFRATTRGRAGGCADVHARSALARRRVDRSFARATTGRDTLDRPRAELGLSHEQRGTETARALRRRAAPRAPSPPGGPHPRVPSPRLRARSQVRRGTAATERIPRNTCSG